MFAVVELNGHGGGGDDLRHGDQFSFILKAGEGAGYEFNLLGLGGGLYGLGGLFGLGAGAALTLFRHKSTLQGWGGVMPGHAGGAPLERSVPGSGS